MDLGHGYLRKGPPIGRARHLGLLVGGLLLVVAAAAGILVGGPGSGSQPVVALVSQPAGRPVVKTPAFVATQLGARRATLPVAALQQYGAESTVTAGGFQVRIGALTMSLASMDGGAGNWTAYAGGASRTTTFGREFVTITGSGAEQLLQVDSHQGAHTWRWRIGGTDLVPRLTDADAVSFVGRDGRPTGISIAPVALLDTAGNSLTPKGLRWTLARHGGDRFLELRLDDSLLPVPYVIDPSGVTLVSFTSPTLTVGSPATWTVNFMATGALGNGSTITATFPTATPTTTFTTPASPVIGLVSGFNGGCSVAAASGGANVVTITLATASAPCVTAGASASLTIAGVTNATQAVAIAAANWKVSTSADTNLVSAGAGNTLTAGAPVKLQMLVPGETNINPTGVVSPASCKNATPSKQAQGTSFGISSVKAEDAYCNYVTTGGLNDALSLTSTDGLAAFVPTATPTLTNGSWSGAVTLNTVGSQTITASDTTDPTKTAASSTVQVYAKNGSGTMTVNRSNVSTGATQSLVFTYTAAAGGTLGGVLRLTAPAAWTAPTALNTAVVFSGTASGTVAFVGQQINFSALTMSAGDTVTITYGPITVPAIGTPAAWSSFEGSIGPTFTALTAGSPSVTVMAADGTGTMTVSPTLVTAGSTSNTHTFSFTAPVGGLNNGTVSIAIPATWGDPQPVSNTSPNYTTSSTGAIAWSSGTRTLSVSGVTLAAAGTLTVVYGNTSGGAHNGAAAVAGTTAGASAFTTTENSSSSSPMVALAASPTVTVDAGAASDFSLTATPASIVAGTPGSVTVTAIDGYGNIATTFIGTVAFTSNDGQAVLPGPYNFTGSDAGVHTFTNAYTLKTAGSRTITGTSGAVTGTSAGVTVNSALPAATLIATAPTPTTAGTGFSVTVTAKDAYGNIATSYVGTVSLTSTDPGAVLSDPYTFVAGDNGSHSLPVTLKTSGSRTVSATDGTLNATTGSITVNPAATSTLVLTGAPASVTAGSTGSVTATATDAYGNTTTGYLGALAFTSSDGAWLAPSNYAFTGADAGVHTFTNAYTLKTSGSQTVTATDTGTPAITGTSAPITVNAAPPSTALSTIVAAPGSIVANGTSTSTVTVQLEDAFGNHVTSSGGTVALATTSGSLSAVTDHANGTYTATLTSPTTTGTASITGTLNAAALASSASVTFTPGPTTNLVVSAPATETAGSGISVSVTAKDAFGNTTPSYTGTVNLTSADPQVPSPGSHVFTGGDAGTHAFPVTLKTAGSWTIAASDGSSSGTSGAVVVSPGATSTLTVSAPAIATAGTPASVTVTAKDAYGNTTTGYTGTVSLTSTDPLAPALGSHTFSGGDAGVYAFSATLKTAGSQTISAGDGSLTASSGAVTVSPASVSTSTSTVTGAPASVVADGSTPVTVTVTLKDAFGNAEPGKTVAVAATGSASVSAATATDSSGVAAFSATDTAVETSTFTATDTTDSVSLPTTPSASFVAGPLATIQISPASSTVAAGVSQVYGVTGSDAYGHSLGAQTATFGIVPDGSCVNATASCSATVSGLHAVTATVSGHTSVASLTVSVGAGSGTTSTLAASPTTIVADGATASTITVTLKDSYGNSLTSGGATVALSTTAGTLSAVTDNGNGTYSANLTATSAGTGTVSGTVNGVPLTATVAVVFTNSDTTPPSLLTASATAGTLTLSYSEALDANSTPATGDFAVLVNLSTDAVTSVTVTGSSVVLSLAGSISPGDLATVSYTGTATKDLAGNAAATFVNQSVLTGAGPAAPASCKAPLRLANDGHTCIAPPPPPPPIHFVGSSPADGANLTALDTITLTANHMASWYAISVAGPGGTTSLASGFGVSYSLPFTPSQPGSYTLIATMDDGFNPSQHITSHFTIVPALPDLGVPGTAGSVESSSGDTTVNWTASTFAEAVRVNIADEPSIGGTFGIGSRVVRVTVSRLADGTALDTFPQPLELVFAAGPAGVPSFSEDGATWSPVPKLTSDTLPAGQADGYFIDPTGAVHVLTRHLTFFGVLAPRSTKLALTVSGSVVRLQGGARRISVSIQMSQSAHVVATLYSPHGERIQSWARRTAAGASTLTLMLPAAKVQRGICTIVLQATTAAQTTESAIPVTLR